MLGMVGTSPLTRGYEGAIPPYAFNLLVLTVESFIQINQVSSVIVEGTQILMKFNKCCNVPPQECKTKRSLYDRVTRAI